MTPTVDDAKARTVVRLRDGRTARLVSVPGRSRKHGDKAVVVLASGAHLSVDMADVEVEA